MWEVLPSKRYLFQFMCLCGLIIITYVSSSVSITYAAASQQQTKHTACPSPAVPTAQSLLVVMLDRSGSLTYQPGATDPAGYSTSVTKALTDLWPGSMLVIPFSNDQTPRLGPYVLSDPAQRATLQQAIDSAPIGGDTPLEQAMHTALDSLQGAASGSRAMIITDGQPDTPDDPTGAKQSQDIQDNLIHQFCQQGIPITPFGLTIDQSTPDGQHANQLLTNIANGTGTNYTDVTGAKDLAGTVIDLYAQWLNLTFTKAESQAGNFPVAIDTFAQQVQIVTFRTSNSDQVALDGPDGQPVQGIEISTDNHYVIATLTQGGVFVAGTYTVHTQADPDAQVYTLVNSPLQIKITAPDAKTLPYGKAITLEASFFNGANVLTPQQGQAQLVAHVTLLLHGQPVGTTNDVVLTQQGTVFVGQTQKYTQAGEINIEINGSYQGVQRQVTTSLQLVKPAVVPSPARPFCTSNSVNCLWQEYHSQVILCGALLLLLLLLLYMTRPGPFGVLENGSYWIALGKGRILHRKLFSKSSIPSSELAGGFDFGSALFALRFKSGKRVYIQADSDVPPLAVRDENGINYPVKRAGGAVPLTNGATITVEGHDVATFKARQDQDIDFN